MRERPRRGRASAATPPSAASAIHEPLSFAAATRVVAGAAAAEGTAAFAAGITGTGVVSTSPTITRPDMPGCREQGYGERPDFANVKVNGPPGVSIPACP